MTKITSLPKCERPRERLLKLGASTLSSVELLAILIGHGSRHHPVLEISQSLLAEYPNLIKIKNMALHQWVNTPGLGAASYCRLQAALELGHRIQQQHIQPKHPFTTSAEIANYCRHHLQEYEQEVFACLFLDNRLCLLNFEILFYGSIDSASVYPREIIKRALYHNAAKLICVHNHPSGNPTPSQADREITTVLTEALALVEIQLLDHLVVTKRQEHWILHPVSHHPY
mgnify:CR=1 FL=1